MMADPAELWNEIKYSSGIIWSPSVKGALKDGSRRFRVSGVEVRDLGSDHFLHGERGLFATQKFNRFEILGEYTGRVVGDNVNGHYVAALEDKAHSDSLGVDAQECGNEIRFINSYINVAFNANVTMRTAYINTYPHILLVCTQDIEPGEEFLLDYGKAYTEAYLTPRPPFVVHSSISTAELLHALPGCHSSDDEDDEDLTTNSS